MKPVVTALVFALLLPFGATAAEAGHAPPAKSTHQCKPDTRSDVILTGKLLCEHCNLHRKETCSPVFAAEGREGEIPVCPETKDIDRIKAAGQHGNATLEVTGTLCKDQDGRQELMISSYVKKG